MTSASSHLSSNPLFPIFLKPRDSNLCPPSPTFETHSARLFQAIFSEDDSQTVFFICDVSERRHGRRRHQRRRRRRRQLRLVLVDVRDESTLLGRAQVRRSAQKIFALRRKIFGRGKNIFRRRLRKF